MIEIKEMLEEDLPFFCEVRNSCAREFLHNPRLFTLEETKNWFQNTSPKYYIIYFNEIKIGYFRTSDYDSTAKRIYIGCDLHEGYRNKGLGYAAYKNFIHKIFNNLNLDKIQLEVLSTNVVAKKLYHKLGFVKKPEQDKLVDREGVVVVSEFWVLEKVKFYGDKTE